MRVRLMREHLGVDVDELEVQEANMDLLNRRATKMQEPEEAWDPDQEQETGQDHPQKQGHTLGWAARIAASLAANSKSVVTGAGESAALGLEKAPGKIHTGKVGEDEAVGATQRQVGEDEETYATRVEAGKEPGKGFASTVAPTMDEKIMAEDRPNGEDRAPNGVKDGKTKEQTEEDAPAVNSPHDNEGHDASEHVAKKAEEDDLSQSRGAKTTQSGGVDDTRKLPLEPDAQVEHDGEVIKPLAPITESHEGSPPKIKDSAPPPDIKANGHRSTDNLAIPSDPNASSSTSASFSTLNGGADGSHSPNHSPPLDSDRAKANEGAASRNAANASARRNLREKPNAYNIPVPAPAVDPHGFADPLTDKFYKDVWMTAAARNTQAFRKVFRCVPDDLVSTWKQYRVRFLLFCLLSCWGGG